MNLLDAQLAAGVRINAAEFAREHGVSVRTVYRHQARIRAEGQWQSRSKRPRSSPRVTPPELDAWICKLRTDLGVDNGADFIRDALIEVHEVTEPAWRVPARSTINRVLARHDLLERNPAKRPHSSFRRFVYARPRDCYQIDATNIRLTDGSLAAVFEVLDDCTRTLLACHAAPAETADGAITAIKQAFAEYGVPAIVLSDNGSAFTSRLTQPGSISTFTQCLLDHGVRPINSSPYHPQTCGKVERHHQTLKKWLSTRPAAHTITELQTLLDTYRDHYQHRRHSALPARGTPTQAWTAAASLGGPGSLPIQADATLHRCTVAANGAIAVAGHITSVGRAYRGTTVTAIRDGHHVTVYDPDGHPIGYLHLEPSKRYITLTRTHHDQQLVTHLPGLPLNTCLGTGQCAARHISPHARRRRPACGNRARSTPQLPTVRGDGPVQRCRRADSGPPLDAGTYRSRSWVVLDIRASRARRSGPSPRAPSGAAAERARREPSLNTHDRSPR